MSVNDSDSSSETAADLVIVSVNDSDSSSETDAALVVVSWSVNDSDSSSDVEAAFVIINISFSNNDSERDTEACLFISSERSSVSFSDTGITRFTLSDNDKDSERDLLSWTSNATLTCWGSVLEPYCMYFLFDDALSAINVNKNPKANPSSKTPDSSEISVASTYADPVMDWERVEITLSTVGVPEMSTCTNFRFHVPVTSLDLKEIELPVFSPWMRASAS